MKGINVEWAIQEIDKLIHMSDQVSYSGANIIGTRTRMKSQEIAEQAEVVERILSRVIPDWDSSVPIQEYERWGQLREAASRAKAVLLRERELHENLGDNAPHISASEFHPWIWSGAESLWRSGHYREAVEGAIRKLNAETQNKLGRKDISETDLFNQAFSEQSASENTPRLHRMTDDGSKTFKSVQRGARMFAEGAFAGIRNPLAHESEHDMTEQVALEYLAALSVLSRWVDESTLETAR